MGQQLGIVVLVDVAAAVEENDLRGNLWFVDNGGWDGSQNEGTGNLVTALEMTDVLTGAGPAVLNWLAMGVGSVPITVPQAFFLAPEDGEALMRGQPASAGKPGRLARLSRGRSCHHAIDQTALRSDGGHDYAEPAVARFHRKGRSPVSSPGDQDLTFDPIPVIQRIEGEAVMAGAIFPAQYGSPHLFTDGLYWSASVNPAMLGLFRYTLWVTLLFSRRDADGVVSDHSVTLPHDGFLKLSIGNARSGFADADVNRFTLEGGASWHAQPDA